MSELPTEQSTVDRFAQVMAGLQRENDQLKAEIVRLRRMIQLALDWQKDPVIMKNILLDALLTNADGMVLSGQIRNQSPDQERERQGYYNYFDLDGGGE